MKRVRTPLFLMLPVLWLAACSQGEGDPCQVTSDCASGLLCCPGAASARGVCEALKSCPDSDSSAGRGGRGGSGGSGGAAGDNASDDDASVRDGGGTE